MQRPLFALESPGRRWSQPQMAEWSISCGNWFTARGVQAEQVVALVGAPGPEYLAALLGIWQAGGLVLPLNPRLPQLQIESALAQAGARWCLGLNPPDRRALAWQDLPAPPEQAPLEQVPGQLSCRPETPWSLILTSGSSGRPKLALHTCGQHLASATSLLKVHPLLPADRWLLALPLFHIGGLAILMRCSLAGATVVMPEAGQDLATALLDLRPTHLSLVATQLQRLLAHPETLPVLQTAKMILLGGSAIPQTLLQQAYQLRLPVHTSYGATETSSLVSCTPAGADLETLCTSGQVLPGHTLRIAADGEIQIHSAAVFAGYFASQASLDELCQPARQPRKPGNLAAPFSVFTYPCQLEAPRHNTASPGQTGWLSTRDRGLIDRQGRLQVLGRLDNLFISGGENIQPEEIEAALLQLAGIRQAIVVPVSHREYGQRPVAFVDAEIWQAERWQNQLREVLPAYKIPDAFYRWPQDQVGLKPSRLFLQHLASSQSQSGL